MAKKKADTNGQGESIAGYFRTIFAENPKLLKERSNDKLIERWLADHPGQEDRMTSVRNSLANLKSGLRSKKRRRRKAEADEQTAAPVATATATPRKATAHLQALEEYIDEGLMMARKMDPEGLANVIGLLRRARNEVVWKLG